MNILGLSAFYHDSAAALVRDGELVAAAQEERFSRLKHDPRFPSAAVRYCLAEGGVGSGELDAVVFYDKPVAKFARILETYLSVAPRGFNSFLRAMPAWLKGKLWIPLEIEKCLEACGLNMPELYFTEHHEAHAASAFFPSPFSSAAIVTADGVGEWACTSVSRGDQERIRPIAEQRFPHSLGLLYSAFTYYTGFRVNSGEYKLMGLAPYGTPRFVDLIRDNLVDLRDDGSFRLDLDYFGFVDGLTMTNERFDALFGGPPRQPEDEITSRDTDLARSIQVVTEEIMLKTAQYAHEVTGEEHLCLAGGVALNCVANGRILREGPFREVWIQPAAGDAGGAIGAALAVWHQLLGNPRHADGQRDSMKGAYLGPGYDDGEIAELIAARGLPAEKLSDEDRPARVAELVAAGRVVGLFDGRMEFGPRALGNRSIIGDARSPAMQGIINRKIKFRESFRPFAPACLAERAGDFFELDRPSPYMLLVAPVRKERRTGAPADDDAPIHEQIHRVRSDVPAVTHVDFSARIQTVDPVANPRFHGILTALEALTGEGIAINTSFNVRGEPIVCTPEDAYACFMGTEMDHLVLGSYLLEKGEQPPFDDERWPRARGSD